LNIPVRSDGSIDADEIGKPNEYAYVLKIRPA